MYFLSTRLRTHESLIAATLAVLRIVRNTLQSMLSPGRQLATTPLQLELLGVSQALFKLVLLSQPQGRRSSSLSQSHSRTVSTWDDGIRCDPTRCNGARVQDRRNSRKRFRCILLRQWLVYHSIGVRLCLTAGVNADSLLPLVAHAVLYVDLCRMLIKDLLDDSVAPSDQRQS